MRKALIPCDGQWHTLPHQPVVYIEASLLAEVDIGPKGIGRARSLATDSNAEPITVFYRTPNDPVDNDPAKEQSLFGLPPTDKGEP